MFSHSVTCHFLNIFFFENGVKLTVKRKEDTQITHKTPAPTHAWVPQLSTSLAKVVHLLQVMNLHGHIIITPSP